MIPRGALGGAAANARDQLAHGPVRNRSTGTKGAQGIISGFAIAVIAAWAFAASEGTGFALWQRLAAAAAAGIIAYFIGFRARGARVWIAAPVFALTGAWAVGDLNDGFSWLWFILAFLVIFADQLGRINARG
ncbi:MAG: hypothetical protein ACYCU7_18815 [Acidimicrobiales bacterium]